MSSPRNRMRARGEIHQGDYLPRAFDTRTIAKCVGVDELIPSTVREIAEMPSAQPRGFTRLATITYSAEPILARLPSSKSDGTPTASLLVGHSIIMYLSLRREKFMDIEATLIVRKRQLESIIDHHRNQECASRAETMVGEGLQMLGVTGSVCVARVQPLEEAYEILVVPTTAASNTDFSDACSRIATRLS